MLHGAARRVLAGRDVWMTTHRLRRAIKSQPAEIRVCWDLDNTLVASGELLRTGMVLDDAIVEAEPVPNMLEFFDAMQRELPDAQHLILSARAAFMQRATCEWLEAQRLLHCSIPVLLVPNADAKRRIWSRLATAGSLVIVDDLSYNHELPQRNVHHHLVEFARRTSELYIGVEEIARIASGQEAVEQMAARAAAVVTDRGPLASGRSERR